MDNQKKFGERLNEFIFKLNIRIEETYAFMAIRQGLIMMIPLIVIGSLALMLKSLPIGWYQDVLPEILGGRYLQVLDYIFGGTFHIFSLALGVTTSVSYAMCKDAKVKSERAVVNDCFILAIITLISLTGYMGVQKEDFSVSAFGTTNTFMALVIALVSGYLYFKLREAKLLKHILRPETDVDGMYYIAVQSIIPAAIVVGFFAIGDQLFEMFFHVDSIQDVLVIGMEKLLSCFKGGFATGLVILISIHVMWFFGIHGSNVLEGVMQSNFVNVDGVHIFSKTFQDVFVIMGGCGVAMSLTLAILMFSRKKFMKNVAKLAVPGVIFNISEVIIFGLPMLLNPIFLIPFICVPVVNFIVSYGAMYVGLVPVVCSKVEWTTPVFFSGYQATGSMAGSVLQLVCLAIDIAIYLPFIKYFENHSDSNLKRKVQMLVDFIQNEEDKNQVTSLTGREDMLGSVARLLATDLKTAIEKRQLFMLYQPQVDTEGKCMGAEALIRWEHPIAGYIYPPLIIRLAKESGNLKDLEAYIFDTAAMALSSIEKRTGRNCKLSVNITNESLMRDDFESMIDAAVRKHNVSRDHFWLEITEQDALSSSVDISNKLNSLKKKGHKFLIDDFGMGHTSLLYLQTNSFEIVKIDGTITRDILENDRYIDILKSIVYLGNLLNFTTVAEFVETKEQVDLLKEIGINAFQGYYYSQAVTLDALIKWMKEH